MNNTASDYSQISRVKGTACISAIFAQPFVGGIPESHRGDNLVIYPHHTELKKQDPYKNRKLDQPRVVSKRGVITEFSRKSATNLKKTISKTPDWQGMFELTFADDVMIGKTFDERKMYSDNTVKRFKQYLHKKWNIQIIWKREWQTRKSGELHGEVLPHYHIMFTGMTQNQYNQFQTVMIQIMVKWVDIMGSDWTAAYKVAINPKSYRKIQSARHARVYIGKYFGKVQEDIPEGVSIGRCWGKSKDLPQSEAVLIPVSREESVKIRRFMRKMKKLNKNEAKTEILYIQMTNGWSTYVWIGKADVLRFLEYQGIQTESVPWEIVFEKEAK